MSVVPQVSTSPGWRLLWDLEPTQWNSDIETEVDLSISSPLWVLSLHQYIRID
jgi:hypothetical protein